MSNRALGEIRSGSAHPWPGFLCLALALCAWLAPATTVRADDASEFWPEANLFVPLSPQTRLFFDIPYADGRESEHSVLELATYLDISLKPIVKKFRTEDWQRSRYFWARVGYDCVLHDPGAGGAEVAENRGIVALLGKAMLPAEVVAEARVRADLRWIGDDYSTRHRYRIEFTREFTVLDHTVVPFLNFEWFYDTRYDDWARRLLMFGPEVTVNPHFRFQIFLARQNDLLPKQSTLNALGVNLMGYF